jgi:subtilisin family serine protease
MNGTTSRRSKWLYLPIVPALLSVGIGAAWSSSGSEPAGPAAPRAVLTDTIELDYDQAYYDLGGASVPGLIPGSPVAIEGEVPDGGPRAKPGLLSVLVYMDPALRADAAQRADVRAFAAHKGGKVQYEYSMVLPNVLNLRDVPVSELEALKELPGVVRVEIDEYHPNVLALHDSTPLIRALQSQITGAGYSADGTGVRICVCDTGIDSDHLMYSDRIDASAGYDFYNDDSNPEDDHGHGTHVSGIALGGTGLSWDPCGTGSVPFQGVAPKATLIGAKILNQFGGADRGQDSESVRGWLRQ